MDLFRKKAVNSESEDESSRLARCLSALDLVFLGVGAIIGAGIFVLTGIVAATHAGPGIVFSYILAGLACAFSAYSYAELAAAVGGCGSAYGYAYTGFGELVAWIVGWDLILEYAISVPAVSVGWSGYFNDLLKAMHIIVPADLLHAPQSGGVFNVLSMSIILFLMLLLSIGIKSSTRVNNLMVFVKLAVLCLFIIIASSNVNPANWSPFLPFGWEGVVQGGALIFFAYIGFDAVSTAAEEAINPQRDLPVGILGSLILCTLFYIIVSGLLTGIVPYPDLNVSSPVTHAMLLLGYRTAAGFIGVGAVAGLTTVMLVLFYGLTRIVLAMSRDGLLPRFFAKTSPKTKAPVRIIIICGILMSLIAALLPISELAELVNIGTLFAFITVCIGVIVMRYTHPDLPRPFRTPFMPVVPILGVISCLYLLINLPTLSLLRFVIWMAIGLVIYFSYSYKHSALNGASFGKGSEKTGN
ncbi:amino acid transporter PotE [Legionella quinlivanii]|uniref:Amino acid transporter PotE n=1 Tax=Legionella quinlivanii TaxID=45073 RepID=A0A0W0Y4I3_9GAMM|nr:amino acid permease [Legionella quinlivanii]KTD51932.1 amino acid transporter PotE [Legionella quinlivanii]SEF85190.1 amino acid/polyamine/organocation transporter, APC superfamily (TC 2.A.3) [Legionella quinlivanii DSM 21216]STY09605.1 basic amino acid/polyamine antiporter, APA family [Legionella quinlivanii]